MPSVQENYDSWNNDWDANLTGDEWFDQAEYCKQPYVEWKECLINTFIKDNIVQRSTVLEIGPGHGRWTQYLIEKAESVILVDISPRCLAICRRKFSNNQNIQYILNDGKHLSEISDSSVDFVWSYDSFVFMESDVFKSYFNEFRRVLKPHGIAVIHHPGRNYLLERLKNQGRLCWRIAQYLSSVDLLDTGSRSKISRNEVRKIAARNGLKTLRQVDSWGEGNQYNCKKYGDVISVLVKRSRRSPPLLNGE